MKEYFKYTDSIASVYGESPKEVLNTMAQRFIGENPPKPFVLRSYYENGVIRTKKGAAALDFEKLFPYANEGDYGAAAGELWCPKEKKSGFVLECESETLVFLNGKLIVSCDSAGSREFQTELKQGRNRWLLVARKQSGFRCSLTNRMPQWEPCSYIMPFKERKGAAGFVFALYSGDEIPEGKTGEYFLNPVYWGDSETGTGREWIPGKPQIRVPWERDGEVWYIWTQMKPADSQKTSQEQVHKWLEKQKDAYDYIRELRIEASENEDTCQIAWLIETDWKAKTFLNDIKPPKGWEMQLPVEAEGECGEYLFLGPLDAATKEGICSWKPDGKEFLTRPFAYGNHQIFWKTKYEHTVIRPFVETALYGRWTYPLGVTLYGMLKTGQHYGDESLVKYVGDFISLVARSDDYAVFDRENYGFPGISQQLLWLDALDDCGSFGSCMLEYLRSGSEKSEKSCMDMKRIAGRIREYMLKEQIRNEDGSFKRRDDSMWIDDMYMSVPFLVRYGELFHDSEAWEEACRQLLLYRDHFCFKPEGMENEGHILSHMRKLEHEEANQIPWSRGNGWVVFSLSELLPVLPKEHRLRASLVEFFRNLCEGYQKLQDKDGLWHQILDEKDTYPETSAAAMFICAMSRGIRYHWFEENKNQEFAKTVFRAWKGLTEKAIDRHGNLYGVCQGSGWSYEREYYRKLTWNFNDTHGIGIVMLAGVETEKLKTDYIGENHG